jgi:hypothetical protein
MRPKHVYSMKVYLEQGGGLTRFRTYASVDSDTLQPEEASELHRLINDANLFQLPSQPTAPSRGADYLEYKITLETNNNRKHSIKTTDLSMPRHVRPLVTYLKQKAIEKGRDTK